MVVETYSADLFQRVSAIGLNAWVKDNNLDGFPIDADQDLRFLADFLHKSA